MAELYPIRSDLLTDIMSEYGTWFGMEREDWGWMNSSSGC